MRWRDDHAEPIRTPGVPVPTHAFDQPAKAFCSMVPPVHTGPWSHGTDRAVVSSGGITRSVAGTGWQFPVWESPGPATAAQCNCALTEPRGWSVTVVGAGSLTRTCRVGNCSPCGPARPSPPYPWTVQDVPLRSVSTSVAYRWPAPGLPGTRLAVRSPVWQRLGRLGGPLVFPAGAVASAPVGVPEPVGRPAVARVVEDAEVREDDEAPEDE